ncbi:MAG: serine hydrolase domain-containing protein [Actinomycetota bacterium]|nr:serine hydrolase domain-containing protein [Actinomycetota bacterium]
MNSVRPLTSAFAAVVLMACTGADTLDPLSTSEDVASVTSAADQKAATTFPLSTSVAETPIRTSSTVAVADANETTATAEPTSKEGPVAPEGFAQVSQAVEDFVDRNGLNGAGLVVVDRDQGVVYHNHWGEFSVDRVSFIASTSKIISAGVLIHLHGREILDLDAPIGDVINYAGSLSTITPAQLLSGSSGIPGLQAGDFLYICMFLPDSSLQKCAAEGLSVAASDPRTVAPDTEFRYGGIQLQIAAAVAEIASGKNWSDLVDEIYVQPCGTSSLGYTNPWVPLQATSGEYPDWDGDVSLLPLTDNPHIGGGAYITTGDYGKLLSMHLNDGKCGDHEVLSRDGVKLMQQNRSGEVYGSPIGYGMGWWTQSRRSPYEGSTGEDSGNAGQQTLRLTDPGLYGSTAWLQPDDGFGAYLVVESTTAVGQRLARQLYPLVESAVQATR